MQLNDSSAVGQTIRHVNGRLLVPRNPTIPFIEGDGVGPEIWRAARPVFDAAVDLAYKGRRRVLWLEVLAGEKAFQRTGTCLPDETLNAVRRYHVAIKGPLSTPPTGGIRNTNVALRQLLDLYASLRPVRYYAGAPSPLKHPECLHVVIFRENMENVYAGIEWREGSPEANRLIDFLHREMGRNVRRDSAMGITPVSATASKRLVRRAIQYALDHRLRSVTLAHKGDVLKHTEGAFRDWGHAVAREEFSDAVIAESESEVAATSGKVVMKDRIADALFQHLLMRPQDYDVIATSNMNGDYLADACAAQVGGPGMAPEANFGDEHCVFETTHGTAAQYAGQDVVNPSSLILAGCLLFRHLGWGEAADLIETGLSRTLLQRRVTYDLHRQMDDAELMSTSEFAGAIVENLAANAAAA